MSEGAAGTIAGKAELAIRRLEEMSRQADGLAPSVRDLMSEALEEVAMTLEELRAAGEDLAEANEGLRRAQSKLGEGRRAYQELFDFAPDGYLITNTFGTIRLANVAAKRLLAGGRDVLHGKPLTVFVAAEHRTSFFVALERVRRNGERIEWSGRLVPRGDARPFTAGLVVVGRPGADGEHAELLWHVRDLSERERFERALLASELAFRTLAENSPDPIVRLDRQLRVEYANAAAEAFAGDRGERIGSVRPGEIGFAAKAAQAWAAACARALGDVEQIVELSFETPSGPRWLESRIVPEHVGGREVDGLLIASRDVTDRRRAELALRETDELKTAMLAGVSHELRTPLTAIAGAAAALAAAEAIEAPGLLEVITGETTRLERMVANLLDLSRLKGSAVTPRPEIYPVETMVGTALHEAAGALADAEVLLDLSEEALLVMADPLMCERILVNLLHNAVTHGAPPVRVASRAVGGSVELSVADAGGGVSPGEERRIFEPFVHGGRQGSAGMGLALAEALAEAQGARLELRAGAGRGACFVLRMPAAATGAEATGGVEGAGPRAAEEPGRR